ncbi:MAG: hypothetical protein ABJF23_32395 [Bryobacteraceae bacterium]
MSVLPTELLGTQVIWLFLLAIPIACIAWTITHEEIFREAREYCVDRSHSCQRIYERKFFYVFTCEYCFSHYVTAAVLFLTQYRLLFDSWRGYVIAGFSLVWIANFYMAIFGRLRLEIKSQRLEIAQEERQIDGDGPRPQRKAAEVTT